MGQLRTLQEELSKILSIGSQVKESHLWKEGLPQRLQVYRNTVHGNAYDTLDSDYPLTKKQFSEEDWFHLSEEFFKKFPPQFWELNGCIVDFPRFLKMKKQPAFLSELAQYELCDLQAFIHPAVVKKGLGKTNPTLITKVFQHQIFDWVLRSAPADQTPKQLPEVLIFYRDTDHEGYIQIADPLELLLLDHFQKPGAKLDDAEPIRAKLFPKNTVPLKRVLGALINKDLILL